MILNDVAGIFFGYLLSEARKNALVELTKKYQIVFGNDEKCSFKDISIARIKISGCTHLLPTAIIKEYESMVMEEVALITGELLDKVKK